MSEVGKPISRLDGRAKVTGHARYAADWPVKGVTHAVIFQSTLAKGKIKSFDLKAARQVPGVIEILTHENAPSLKFPKGEGGGGIGEAFIPLQDATIYYNGQHIGAVIAETLEAAMQAAELVKVRYSEGSPHVDMDKLMSTAHVVKKMANLGNINHDQGTPEKVLKNCEVVFEQTYISPIENHNPMEPSATLVDWSGGELKVYDSTQAVWSVANLYSQSFKQKREAVHVITKFVGGAFGCKGSMWPHQFIAVMAAQKTGRPVKLVLRRSQMFTGVGHRARTVQKVTLGCQPDGKLRAIHQTIVNGTAVNKDYSERSGSPTPVLYKCEHVKTVHRVVKLNYQVPTYMRAPGEVTGAYAVECAMDELAHQLKIDPLELRKRNYSTDEDGKPFSSKSLMQCYDEAASRFQWAKRNPRPGETREGDFLIGHGMATSTYPSKRFKSTAQVELFDSGRARVTSATQDLGTGSYTIFPQIAADGLGLPLAQVDFDLGDSRYPQSGVSGGSTTAASVGTAIHVACEDIKRQLAALAARDTSSPLAKAKPEELELRGGRLQVKGNPQAGHSVAELLTRGKVSVVKAVGESPDQKQIQGDYSNHAFGSQFVEVRVHARTGEVRVSRMVGAFACGKIINPKTARSQFQGGMIMGLGMALMEETVPDLRNGRLMVKDLAEYHVPVQADVPEIDIIMVDEKDGQVNPIGVKGVGEIGIVGTAPAIGNAIFNATGIRLRELPFTPDKLVTSLHAQMRT